MAVFRIERTHNYTVMSNYHLRDKSLSLKAKGLLSQMLSLPENWDYTLAGLARINAEGKDAIRAAVAELERAGYLVRSRTRDEKGRLLGTEYIIREKPAFSAEPALEEPASENPTLEEPTQLNKEKNKIPDSQSTESIPFLSAPPVGPALVGQPETKGRKRMNRVSKGEMDSYRELIRENICYDDFVREHPYDAPQLDEMVELMVEAVCSRKETIRVAGNDFPQAVVKSRLLKLNAGHIRFVFDCLRENTTQVRNMKKYLLTVLYNAPVTMESHYAAKVNHDLYSESAAC
ncbi:MAG: helix-turn-helix domain-containing protein [Oscillospiraceae bacterium]|nr:helix-turn-helix domain-containing protein [Oscillospiraceae bacterium]